MHSAVRFLGICLLALAAACSLFLAPIAKYVNQKFPPVDVATQRAQAIDSAVLALSNVPHPNLAFGAPLPALERVLNSGALNALGVRAVRLRGEQQLLRIDADFTRQFTGPDPLLQQYQPEVRGTVSFYAGLTSATTNAAGDPSIVKLSILPVFNGVKVDKVTVKGTFDVTALGNALAAVLNTFAANISGELTRSPLMQINIPTTVADVKNAIHFSNGMADVTLGQAPIHDPVKLTGVAWLITSDSIAGIAQTVPVEPGVSLQSVQPATPFSKLQQLFLAALNGAFDPPPSPSGPWVAIRKDLLAYVTNSVVQQAAVCIHSNATLPEQSVSQEIKFPDASTIDCSPKDDCTPTRPCDFPAQVDTRDCSTCVLWRPGWPLGDGGCALRGNDPFCEAAKAAQNAIYQADAAAKKLDCERLKTQDKLACEAKKATKKLLCETGKEALVQLAQTGKFARLDANVKGRTNDLTVCLNRFHLTSAFDRIDVGLRTSGSASADVRLHFEPLDIVGHMACQVPWNESRSFNATLRQSDVNVSPRIQIVTDANGARAKFTLPKGQVPLHLEPGPTEFLLSSPNLILSCAGFDLLAPLAVAATPFVPELRGDIDYKYDEREMTVDLPMPKQTIGSVTLTGRLTQSGKAFFLIAEMPR